MSIPDEAVEAAMLALGSAYGEDAYCREREYVLTALKAAVPHLTGVQQARSEGYQDGYSKGYQSGYAEGAAKSSGYDTGYNRGFVKGLEHGRSQS